MLVEPGRLTLRAPGWSRDLPRKGGELRIVQFDSLPPESELKRIGAFIERHPAEAPSGELLRLSRGRLRTRHQRVT